MISLKGSAKIKVGEVWGYINNKGEITIQPQFDEADNFTDGMARVIFANEEKYIDTNGDFMW
ncbi:hypothetical protein RIVM261_078950 [Rivularia sp. IAM M-261]|nr:hypothetical protein RIVM261_078950 [Rivularia sp. IAM M-261]